MFCVAGAVEFMLYMAYSHKVAPAPLRAKHTVVYAGAGGPDEGHRPWSHTLWRTDSYVTSDEVRAAFESTPNFTLVWGVQAGAFDHAADKDEAPTLLFAFFEHLGLLLDDGLETPQRLFACVVG